MSVIPFPSRRPRQDAVALTFMAARVVFALDGIPLRVIATMASNELVEVIRAVIPDATPAAIATALYAVASEFENKASTIEPDLDYAG